MKSYWEKEDSCSCAACPFASDCKAQNQEDKKNPDAPEATSMAKTILPDKQPTVLDDLDLRNLLMVLSTFDKETIEENYAEGPITSDNDLIRRAKKAMVRIIKKDEDHLQLRKLVRKILTTIGQSGDSEEQDILCTVIQDLPDCDEDDVSTAIDAMVIWDLLDMELVDLKSGTLMILFYLTEKGRKVYRSISGKEAEKPEMEYFLEEFGSYRYGYACKEFGRRMDCWAIKTEIRDQKGWIVEDGDEGQMTGKSDVTLIFPGVGKTRCAVNYEIEDGSHSEEEFIENVELFLKTRMELRIICTDDDVLEEIKGYLIKWAMDGGTAHPGTTIMLATLDSVDDADTPEEIWVYKMEYKEEKIR